MSLHQRLWETHAELARDALDHRFVRGIGDGTLPLESFETYVAQDAFFLESFARAYAVALSRSADREGLYEFADLLAGVLEEIKLHEGYAERWGVHLGEVIPAEATLAYTEFLLSTAALGTVGETCAAMTPCMRLYAFLGACLEREGYEESNPYGEWIRTYADPGFDELAATLERLLDRYADDTPAVRRAYGRAMSLEVGFFEAAARTGEER